MSDEQNPNDGDFLDYLERLGGKCQSLSNLIDQKIQAALKGQPASGQSHSGNYLEEQNKFLLEQLIKARGGSTPDESGVPDEEPDLKPSAPPAKQPKKATEPPEVVKPKAFWR